MVAIKPCGITEDHPHHSTTPLSDPPMTAETFLVGGFRCPGIGPEGLQWYLNPEIKPPPGPLGD